ncbi:MAG: TerB family tellurite resistance protein [Anaerolinea sp.]|nr:TerB family tellurite resistance protein [Anaerolinea sp.]
MAKVLVAAAWADGELSHDEINSMKRELLTKIPDLSAQQWASVAIYMESPVDDAERARLVQELRARITTPLGKQLVFDTLNDLVAADGQVSDAERAAVAEVRAAIESGNSAGLGRVSRLFKGRSAPPPAATSAPNREDYLDDFVKNRVYYVIRRRLEQGGITPKLSDAEIRKLSLAGGLMAVVARTNPDVTGDEQAAMLATLQQNWHLNSEQASFLVEVALSQLPGDLDSFRLADAFAAASDYDERGQLVDALFAIVAADHAVNDDEVEKIRIIANTLVLTHQRFIEAKLKATRSSQ